jgi:potassium/hydrogen antiporter
VDVADPALFMAAAAGLLLVGVLASKAATKLGIPALLLFLIIGMAAGSEGIGGIDFADYQLAQNIGVVALAFILYAGGLDTEWADVRPAAGRAVLLATIGVAVTALVAGAVATWVLGVPPQVGLLLGAIISSTDAAAVFSVLRSHSVGLRGMLRPLLELESGSNDPMAVFLTVAFLQLVTEPDTTIAALVPVFILQMVVGGAVGYLLARGAVAAINRVHIGYEGLYPVVMIALVLLTYGVASLLGGSGFLAVYVAGLVMGNHTFLHRKSLMRFSDGLAWLMQITMFLVLGLLVFPSDLVAVALPALAVSAALVFVARPLAAAAVLLPTRVDPRETLMVSWVGLRGAVPIILATFPLVAGIPQAELLFNVVFFIVLTSVLVQGTTLPRVARWLGVDAPLAERKPFPLESVEVLGATTHLHDLTIPEGSPVAGRSLVHLALPADALVVLVNRHDTFVVPSGSTELQAGDAILLLADDEGLAQVTATISGEVGAGEP